MKTAVIFCPVTGNVKTCDFNEVQVEEVVALMGVLPLLPVPNHPLTKKMNNPINIGGIVLDLDL